ncbi:hypothetical protein [Effusibacillus consociatus]|uniref:Mobile element protein n=1 Tax=Effusibacillus consociatus TaxID=1117041 RepID=A0ABV9Q2D5_9BACL
MTDKIYGLQKRKDEAQRDDRNVELKKYLQRLEIERRFSKLEKRIES